MRETRIQRSLISMDKERMLMMRTSVCGNENEQMYVLRIIGNVAMFT